MGVKDEGVDKLRPAGVGGRRKRRPPKTRRGKRRIGPLRSKTDNASSVQLSNPTEAFLVGQYPELVDGEVQLVSSSNRGRVGRFRVMIFSKAGTGNGGGALVDQGLIGSPQVLPPNPSETIAGHAAFGDRVACPA